MSKNSVTPKNILEFVRFNREDNNWKYNESSKDMYAYQAEGVAGILNRLQHFKTAILADEVGMGKTYQALAVIANQFKIKKESNVLIISPRIEVLRQWKEVEYKAFRDNHLINKCNLPEPENLYELENFANGFSCNNKNIVFAKTTSFSQNIDIEKCKKDIEKFDLIVIDEAHLYRNYSKNKENNNRNKNALEIFKDYKNKILLMTATPLHSRKSDISNIINVFRNNINNFPFKKSSENIMKYLMIRRLRVMSRGLNKYHYREEIEIPIEINSKNNDYKDELFFALLQKNMIEKGEDVDFSQSKNLLDLLEGTTYFNNIEDNLLKNENKILTHTTCAFRKIYKTYPSNQKYNVLLSYIENSDEKALIFVRRRASAIELVRKYIKEFDEKAWKVLVGNSRKKIPKRDDFDRSIGIKENNRLIGEFVSKEYIKNDKEFLNKYKEYIKFPKGTRTKTILEHMANNFFDNYSNINKENFSSFKEYIQKLADIQDNKDEADNFYMPKSIILDFFKTKKRDKSTSASKFIKKFDKGRAYADFFTKWLPEKLNYKDETDIKKELIKSAILHASIGVIELFKCDIRTKNYKSFCNKVSKIIDSSRFKKEIEEFLGSFDKFEKYLVNNDDKSYNLAIFHNAQPAYAYLSNTKNKTVTNRFNSPFFPYILCGTSTLQEGLNLHLHCNKVYHFSSANSMGDDEQRTGRVDRVHGKMNRELDKDINNKLKIHYLYLTKTFDEENLRKMLCSKRHTEKKIDKCLIEANVNEEKIIANSPCDKPISELLYKNKNSKHTSDNTEPFSWRIPNF